MIQTIIKRNGTEVPFCKCKITKALEGAFKEVYGKINARLNNKILATSEKVLEIIEKTGRTSISVEETQDICETVLMSTDKKVAKAFMLYRYRRSIERDQKEDLFENIGKIVKITDRENANVGNGPSAKLLQIAEAAGKTFAEKFLISKEVRKAMDDKIIHPHDFSWYGTGTTTCTFERIDKLLAEGFDNGQGFIRSPKSIRSALSILAIIFQSNQNEQHGGQAIAKIDTDIAPYVKLEIERQKKIILDINPSISPEQLEEKAWELTKKETYQAMEALVHNLNTMHSRAGAQIPFTSINFGLDTTREGRLISESLLLAFEKGLGKGEQPLFPILIFTVKEGVNYNPEDPNYDLFKLSWRVSSERLYPNYCFQDATLSKDFPGIVPRMGCRTEVGFDINLPPERQTCEGRGNLSFTTINLPRLALTITEERNFVPDEAKFLKIKEEFGIDIPSSLCTPFVKAFFNSLYDTIGIVEKQLLERFEYQGQFKKKDFPFLMSGNWIDSETLGPDDEVREVLKHGTLSMGFIGLAETLKTLTGFTHAESEDSQLIGLEIIKFMRKNADALTKKNKLNFSLLATPAEGLAGKLLVADREKFGIVEGVTDKEWYTNSFHVPVEHDCNAFEKIEIEGPYHKYCNAGQISYIELKSSPKNNLASYEKILRAMKEHDMGYCAINFPIDTCRSCGYRGFIEEDCPVCKSSDISRIRRITGYLAELDMFNHGKKAEAKARKKHG